MTNASTTILLATTCARSAAQIDRRMHKARLHGQWAQMRTRIGNVATTGQLAAVFAERLVDSYTWVRVWAWPLAWTGTATVAETGTVTVAIVTEAATGTESGGTEEGATGMSVTGTVLGSAAEAAVEDGAAAPSATVGADASVVVAAGTAAMVVGVAAEIVAQALKATTPMSMTTRSTVNTRSTASRGHLPVRATGRARKNVANEGDDSSEPAEHRLVVTCRSENGRDGRSSDGCSDNRGSWLFQTPMCKSGCGVF